MLILHAAPFADSLAIWGEAQPQGPKPEPPHHPYSATFEALAEAIGMATDHSNHGEHVAAWLPSRGNNPVPSSPMVDVKPALRGKPRIKPWLVSALRLDHTQAAMLLRRFHGRHVMKTGVVVGPSLAYWCHALQFAVSLTARQRFLPSLDQQGSITLARWTTVLVGDDGERLVNLAKLMPPAARALADDDSSPPSRAAQTVLRDFLNQQVDALVRGSVEPAEEPREGFDSVHDAWLHALMARDRQVLMSQAAQLQQLRHQISEWQRPIAVAAGSPYRLCFRLEEPPEPKPDDGDTPALVQDDWYLRYLLQPHDDHSLLLPVDKVWANSPDDIHPDFNAAEFLLGSLAQASTVCQPVAESLKRKRPTGRKLNTMEAHHFLGQQAEALQQAGFGVMLPAWWSRRGTKMRPGIRATAQTPAMQGGSGLSAASLIELNVDIALGDETISLEELDALADLKAPLVRFRGQWVEIDADDIRAAADYWRNRGPLTLREAVNIGLGADERADADRLSMVADGWLQELLDNLQQKGGIQQMEAPDGFAGQLRPYQQLGYSWLAFLRQWGLGACLADDMGLGKTPTTLAALQLDCQQGNDRPNLIVCPTSVINNWQREAARFTPDLTVLLHHGPNRHQGEELRRLAADHQAVITSYGTLNRDQGDLDAVPWRGVILDEAQNVKNHLSQQARAASSLEADYRVALTGTPVENHVGDLWAIMQFLNPGLLGTQAQFKRSYFQPIQGNRDEDAAARLKRATGPFILRRLKTDRSIIDDLPDKRETKQYCNLTREQVTLYEAVLREAETRLEDAEGMKRRGSILDTLTKLKQVCNHPRQLLGDNSAIAGRSGKLARLDELLDEILPAGDRVLIFSQFAEMGSILQQHVQETYGVETPFLHGGVPRKRRDQMVERFQNDPHGPQAFVLSVKAGGSGLNLPRANHVIHYDRWWNPAVENQATDRAFRIGQTKDVHVHKFICAGTLEDRIDLMIDIKQETAQQVVGATPERWLTELSNAELRDVLALSATPDEQEKP